MFRLCDIQTEVEKLVGECFKNIDVKRIFYGHPASDICAVKKVVHAQS